MQRGIIKKYGTRAVSRQGDEYAKLCIPKTVLDDDEDFPGIAVGEEVEVDGVVESDGESFLRVRSDG